MNVSEIVAAVEQGQIPSSLEGISEWLDAIANVSKETPSATAILIASARKNHFGESAAMVREWMRWARERYDICESYVHHFRNVGDMLLPLLNKPEREILFRADFTKLVALSRLSPEKLGAFLAVNDVAAMPRDAVRSAVSLALGEYPKEKNGEDGEAGPGELVQGELDLWGAVDRLCQVRPEGFDELGEQIDAPDKAAKVFWAGLGLVDSGIKFAEKGGLDAKAIRQWGSVMVAQQKALLAALKLIDPSVKE